jgi:hypothetical protein
MVKELRVIGVALRTWRSNFSKTLPHDSPTNNDPPLAGAGHGVRRSFIVSIAGSYPGWANYPGFFGYGLKAAHNAHQFLKKWELFADRRLMRANTKLLFWSSRYINEYEMKDGIIGE